MRVEPLKRKVGNGRVDLVTPDVPTGRGIAAEHLQPASFGPPRSNAVADLVRLLAVPSAVLAVDRGRPKVDRGRRPVAPHADEQVFVLPAERRVCVDDFERIDAHVLARALVKCSRSPRTVEKLRPHKQSEMSPYPCGVSGTFAAALMTGRRGSGLPSTTTPRPLLRPTPPTTPQRGRTRCRSRRVQ
jgi:hypothetical protein